MIKYTGKLLLALCLIFTLGAAGTAFAQTTTVIEPKAENFVFYVDNSGSMGFPYRELGMPKSKIATDLLLAINNELPELDANFGVYTYGPYRQYLSVTAFNRQAMENAFKAIPTSFEIFGRQTPMGAGLQSLDNTISRLQDRVAVVVLTDGESNIGPEPYGVMRDMYAKYGNRICFHFISFAQRPSAGTTVSDEQAFVNALAGINPCSVTGYAEELKKDFVRADFIREVFYDVREVVTAPAPQPAPIIIPEDPAPVEEVIVFSNITFDFDKAVIRPEYRDILREAARIIQARPEKNVLVEGHTCNIGPAEYNMGLSQRRAQSVADFLAGEGVSRDRLETRGYGLTMPRFDNNTREGRSLNRRVEMNLQ